jgi:gamma-polyglutamate biosynthesis protein CapA
MNPKAEYVLILAVAVILPLASYFFFTTYFTAYITSANSGIATFIPRENREGHNNDPISLLFVGDIMLDRTIRKDGEQYGYTELFSCLPGMFEGYDEVIGNLEGTITSNVSVSRDAPYEAPESFRFTFDRAAVQALADAGLSIVSIANNHIRDFGDDGIVQTVAHLDAIGLISFGDPRQNMKKYVVHEVEGTRIAFIPYNQFFGTAEQTLGDLSSASTESDLQVVFPHWGDEYTPARADIKQLAHSFVDAGADLIIGAHPHVIQEIEVYQGAPIYYSLGNFIFDQYWEPAVSTGMMVEVTLQDKKITARREILTESIRHGGTCLK